MLCSQNLQDILLKKILVKNWPEAELNEVVFSGKKGGNHTDGGLASDSFKITIKIKNNDKNYEEFYFFAKTSPENEQMRKLDSSDKLFSNETIWYEKLAKEYENIIKNAGLDMHKYRVWPKSFLCERFSNDLSVIVLEDLQKDDYRLSESTISLDETHAMLALKKLGIFHALGYTFKFQNPDLYESILGAIQETNYCIENKGGQDSKIKPSIERGIKELRTKPEYEEFVKLLDERIGKSPFTYQKYAATKRSSNNHILCHGDFLRNNVLFSYDKLGQVKDSILIDFATIRESSPALDLALFIYMSVEDKILNDRNYLMKLLSIYHESVVSTLQSLNGPSDPWNGDINTLEKEFGSYVLYAYIICSFFLGIMQKKDYNLDEMFKLTSEQQIKNILEFGGETINKRLTNMLISFKNNSYDKFL